MLDKFCLFNRLSRPIRGVSANHPPLVPKDGSNVEDRKLETNGPLEIVHEELLRVSCIWCRKLHRVDHLLDFSPVCPTCAAK